MTSRRLLDWTSAQRAFKAERAAPVPGFLANQALERARLATAAREAASRPLVVAGSFDRSAIMTAALTEARRLQASGDRRAFRAILSGCLSLTWSRAKFARLRAAS